MSPYLVGYLVTVAVAFVICAAWASSSTPADQTCSWILAIFGAAAGPVTLLGAVGWWLAHREPSHVRAARRAADVAEHAAREAQATAARLHALGLEDP